MISVSIKNSNLLSVRIYEPREQQDEKTFFEFLQEVLDHEKFGLILEVDGAKAFSQEAKKKLTTWFRTNKEELQERCLGFVRVTKKDTGVERLKSKAMSLAMPCPYFVVSSFDEALKCFPEEA